VSPVGESTCAECGGPAFAHGTHFCVQFENLPQEVWKDFCSWDHVAAWVSKGEPDWDAEGTQPEPLPWWGLVGCIGVLLLVLTVFVLGLVSLVGLVV
jgi:hypothetical protein